MLTRKVKKTAEEARGPTFLEPRGDEPFKSVVHTRAGQQLGVKCFAVFFSSLLFSSNDDNAQAKDSSDSKNKGDTTKTREPSLNRNQKVEQEAMQTRQAKKKQQQQTPAAGTQKPPKVILYNSNEKNWTESFSRRKSSIFIYVALCLCILLLQADNSGSSVDPEGAGEPMETQESAESSHTDKENQNDSQESKMSTVPPPKRWRTFLRLLNTQGSDKVFDV